MTDWEFDRTRPPPSEGQGAWVKCDAQLGYAKFDRCVNERLGSKLGELVRAPIARVEQGRVEGMSAVISRVRSLRTNSLADHDLSDVAIGKALKQASGLIPFLLWIGSGDHGKAGNFVVTPDENGTLALEAIDFGSCFEWRNDGLSGVAILPELVQGADAQQIERTLGDIKEVGDAAIRNACKDSETIDVDGTAGELIRRRDLLRDWLRV
jgi:hypothetical protein